MAQLDILSYFTQLFWLIIIVSIFYLLIVKRVLPSITRIYKSREYITKLTYTTKLSDTSSSTTLNELITNTIHKLHSYL